MILIFVLKPDFLYDHEDNQFKTFGFSNKKTILPVTMICVLLPLVIYFAGTNKKVMKYY